MPSSDNFGFHISVSNGLEVGLQYALSNHCKTVQIFAGNNRSASLKDKSKYNAEEREHFKSFIISNKMNVFIHSVYVINLCSVPASSGKAKYIHSNILHDIQLAHDISAKGVIVHLGSAIGNTQEDAINNLISNITHIANNMPKSSNCKLILESSSGQGQQVGTALSQFAYIYNKIPSSLKSKIGICLDTAHICAGGSAINTLDGLKKYLKEFDDLIGLDILAAIHLNDNPYPVGSRRDVHEIVGNGVLFKKKENLKALEYLLKKTIKNKIPVILETAGAGKEGSSYPSQIEYLRKLVL